MFGVLSGQRNVTHVLSGLYDTHGLGASRKHEAHELSIVVKIWKIPDPHKLPSAVNFHFANKS